MKVPDLPLASFDEKVRNMALKLYREKGVKPSCERCFYLRDPTCPDFPHICVLEEEGKPRRARTHTHTVVGTK